MEDLEISNFRRAAEIGSQRLQSGRKEAVIMPNAIKVATTKDLPPGKAMAVSVGNKSIALFNIGGQYYAIDDECTHAGGSLSEGEVAGGVVTCPWHGATFDVKTGEVLSPPASDKVSSYEVWVEGEDIKIVL